MKLVREEYDAGVAALTLARPAAGNALVPELLEALLAALRAARDDPRVRAVLLRADGAAFSLGGDMRRFGAECFADIQAYAAQLVALLNETILTLAKLPQPVVAVVNGPVTGGSLGLVLACDLVLVSPRASFKAHYATVGFAPDGGWTALLPRITGARRAAACLLTNRTISAEESVAWGLANEMVDEERLEARARETAAKIAAYPAGTMRAAKRLLAAESVVLTQALEAERQAFVSLVAGEEARRGVAAFLDSFSLYPQGDAFSAPRGS